MAEELNAEGAYLVLNAIPNIGPITTNRLLQRFDGGSFCFLGFTTLVTGLLGDMLVRMRMNQEEILYRLKSIRRHDGSDL
jgi:hypothetical protein